MSNDFMFTAQNGYEYIARLVEAGGQYGRNGCLVNGAKPMVEFYLRSKHDHDDLGWVGYTSKWYFVSRCYVETFMGLDGYGREGGCSVHGVALDGRDYELSLSPETCKKVARWLLNLEN